jgi:hypothetical protein
MTGSGHDPKMVLVHPAPGISGVGDYAQELFFRLESPAGRTFLTAGATGDSLGDIVRLMRRIRVLGRVTPVHCELSAGSTAPFWAAVVAKGPVTATVHDPPHPVWWPLRTRYLARNKAISHLLHYPLRGMFAWLQRKLLRRVKLVVLSRVGADNMRAAGYDATYIPHFVYPGEPLTKNVNDRPRAVGIFGHTYGGKGWDRLVDFRRALPSDIEIVIGGVGTDRLPKIDGVTCRGSIPERDLAEFFASFRVLLLPYSSAGRYGPLLSASGVVARAYSYGVPILATCDRNFQEEAERGALDVVGPSADEWARSAAEVIDDVPRLTAMLLAQETLRRERAISEIATGYENLWQQTWT